MASKVSVGLPSTSIVKTGSESRSFIPFAFSPALTKRRLDYLVSKR